MVERPARNGFKGSLSVPYIFRPKIFCPSGRAGSSPAVRASFFSGRPGRRGGLDRCPLAAAETDRIEEHSAHAAADLPTHLGAPGTDAGNNQRDIAADPDRVGAFRNEAAFDWKRVA